MEEMRLCQEVKKSRSQEAKEAKPSQAKNQNQRASFEEPLKQTSQAPTERTGYQLQLTDGIRGKV